MISEGIGNCLELTAVHAVDLIISPGQIESGHVLINFFIKYISQFHS